MKIIFLIITILFQHDSLPKENIAEIHSKHIQALGGRAKLDSVQSITKTGYEIINGSKYSLIRYVLRPAYARHELINEITGDLTITCVYNDTMLVWTKGMEKPVNSFEVMKRFNKEHNKYAKSLFYNSFVDYKQEGYEPEYLGKELVKNKECFKIKVRRTENGVENYYLLDCQTYLLAMQYDVVPDNPVIIKAYYEDYRSVNGIMFAHKKSSDSGKVVFTQSIYNEIIINSKLDKKFFECYPTKE